MVRLVVSCPYNFWRISSECNADYFVHLVDCEGAVLILGLYWISSLFIRDANNLTITNLNPLRSAPLGITTAISTAVLGDHTVVRYILLSPLSPLTNESHSLASQVLWPTGWSPSRSRCWSSDGPWGGTRGGTRGAHRGRRWRRWRRWRGSSFALPSLRSLGRLRRF